MKSEYDIFNETVVPEFYIELVDAVHKLKTKAWENDVYIEKSIYPNHIKSLMYLSGGGYNWTIQKAEDIKEEVKKFSKGESKHNPLTGVYNDEGIRKGDKSYPIDLVDNEELYAILQRSRSASGMSTLAPFIYLLKRFADEFWCFTAPQLKDAFFFVIIGDIGFTSCGTINLSY